MNESNKRGGYDCLIGGRVPAHLGRMVDVLPTLSSILEVVKVRGIEDCLYEAALHDDHYRAGLPLVIALRL
jgi:hypothetical protein